MNFNRSPAVACAVVARDILLTRNSRYYLKYGDNLVNQTSCKRDFTIRISVISHFV